MSGAAGEVRCLAAMLGYARAYAKLGWRVLPVEPGGKHPVLFDWPHRASADAELLARWFGRTPAANLAVATGPGSGIFVLDIDGVEAGRALVELERRHGPLPDLYPQQWTGGGRAGWHAFFAWPDGRQITNSVGKLAPGIDIRGAGGCCMLAPSVTAEPYRWAPDRDPWTLPPAPAPAWLVELLDPPPVPARPWSPPDRAAGSERYLERAVAAELALIAAAPEGRRNDQLNESAFALFRFAAEGRLPAAEIASGLMAAARHAGLPEREASGTIRSAATKRGVRL